jgi:Domain of unknown function (DUF6471)
MIRQRLLTKSPSKKARFRHEPDHKKILEDAAMPTEPERDAWQEFACELVKDAVAQRGLNYPQLAQLLAEKGLDIAPKTLSRRINRGTFDAGFFLRCLTALGVETIDIQGERVADVWLRGDGVWKRGR